LRPENDQKVYKEITLYYKSASFFSWNIFRGLSKMITKLNRIRMDKMARIRGEKELKKVRLKKKLHPRVRLGLMKMGFDVVSEEDN